MQLYHSADLEGLRRWWPVTSAGILRSRNAMRHPGPLPTIQTVLLGVVAAALCAATPARAEEPRAAVGWQAIYATTETTSPAAGSGTPAPPPEHGTLIVRLEPEAVALRRADEETIYDFSAGRFVTLDHARREARAFALHAVPAFRELELENRRVMARMLEAIGQKYEPAEAEADLGMAMDPPARVRLKIRRQGDGKDFLLNGRQATSFVGAEPPLPAELQRALERLLVYEARPHPLIRAELMREARLPRRLVLQRVLAGSVTTITWELKEAAQQPFDVAAAISAYPLQPLEKEGLLELAFRVQNGQAGTAPAAADYVARAERLLAGGRGFEAFLAATELSFATGETRDELLRRARDAAQPDPRMQAVLRALALEARDAQGALAALGTVSAEGLAGGHVLDVLRANQHIRLRQGKDALLAFRRALAVNPFLVGPWIDAGRLYFGSYQTMLAWACLDAARAIAPDSSLLRPVEEIEAGLRRKHPEFY